jgi:crossover junction endodeoxyribonuclease RusA
MIEITFPTPWEPWSINMERTKHWSWRAKRAKDFRLCAMVAARDLSIGMQPPSTVEVELPFDRASNNRDPSNFFPAVKAMVDGLVDAGLWADDTGEYVSIAEPVLKKGGLVVIRIVARGPQLYTP